MKKVKLGDIAHEHKETHKGSKKGIRIVGLEHLEPESISLTNWDVDTDNTFTKFFRKGNILFARRRAYQKKASITGFDGICSGDITVIEAIPGMVVPELLPFIIHNDRLFEFAVEKSAGSLSPRVKWEHLKEYELFLPDWNEQKKMSDFLWKLENLAVAVKEALGKAHELKESYSYRLFSADIPVPGFTKDECQWRAVNLGDYLVQKSNRNRDNEDYQVLSISNKNGFVPQAEHFENGEVASDDKSNYKIVELKDFAYNPARINVGSIAQLKSCENGIISPMYICFSCLDGLEPEFLEKWFDTKIFRDQMLSRIAGSVRICLKYVDMEKMTINLPNTSVQNAIVAEIEKYDLCVEKLNEKISLIREMQRAAMEVN